MFPNFRRRAWPVTGRFLAENISYIRTIDFGVALGCIWAAWTASGDMWLIVPTLILGFIFAVVGIATVQTSLLRKIFGVGVAVTIYFCTGGFLYWHFLPEATVAASDRATEEVPANRATEEVPAATPTPQISLFLQCRWRQMPKVMPQEGRIVVLSSHSVSPEELGGGDLAEYFGPDGSPTTWAHENFIFGHRCELFNYSDAPVFNVETTFQMDVLSVIKNESGSLNSGDLLKTVEWHLNVPKVDAGVATPFVFYILNNWNYFLRFNLPREAKLQYLSEETRVVSIGTASSTYPAMFLNPAPEIKSPPVGSPPVPMPPNRPRGR